MYKNCFEYGSIGNAILAVNGIMVIIVDKNSGKFILLKNAERYCYHFIAAGLENHTIEEQGGTYCLIFTVELMKRKGFKCSSIFH